jgi:nicotinate-nucleotide pyrophosphorylase (carboxylating)
MVLFEGEVSTRMQPNKNYLEKEVQTALDEDIGSGDVSSALIPPQQSMQAEIISREPMLLCGQPWVNTVFALVNQNIHLHWEKREGEWLGNPSVLCTITGPARDILTAERTALNFLQTLSATATQTYHFLQAIKGTKTQLLDTRKTIPGLRYAQKYAVTCAGGTNHRMGLFDAFLIKENHIKACGSITKAILAARSQNPHLFLEIEVETLEELKEASHCKPDRILLDNFSLTMLQEAVLLNKARNCPLEASGNINLANIREIANTGVDFVSIGAMTKCLKAIDLSLLIKD